MKLLGTAGLAGITLLVWLPVLAFGGAQRPNAFDEATTVLGAIPPRAGQAYLATDGQCPGLRWQLIAGIGRVESNHGTILGGTIGDDGLVIPPVYGVPLDGSGTGGNTTPMPAGQWTGAWGASGHWLRAVGPMQFLASTWENLAVDADNSGQANPHDIDDAAASAAELLCRAGSGRVDDERQVLAAYNRSTSYADQVIAWADTYTFSAELADPETLIAHPNVTISSAASDDLRSGIVEPRLMATLLSLADRWSIRIGVFKTGHARCIRGTMQPDGTCSVSHHFHGRAVDIGAVGPPGQTPEPVTPTNDSAKALWSWMATLDTSNQQWPNRMGAPWYNDLPGWFTNSDHQDHLHIAYAAPAPPGQTGAATPDRR